MVSGAGAFDFAVSAGRCRAGCGLCWLWLEGWRLCPLCFALLAVRPVGRGSCLLAVACGGRCWLCLWPGGCAPGGWCCAAVLLEAVRLEAVRLCCDLLAACLLAVRFTRRPCPCWPSGCALWPGGRAPGGLCCRRAGGGPPSWPPLLPSAGPPGGGPLCFAFGWPLVCRSAGAGRRHGTRHEKSRENAAKISSDFSGEVFYAHGLSLVTWYINAPL